MEIELFLGWPPSINNYYSHTSHGAFINSRGKKYRHDVCSAVHDQLPGITLPGKLHVEIVCWEPDRRKRDLDNLMKATLDAITHSGLWEDDSQIDQLCVYRGSVSTKNGMLGLRINPAGPVIPVGQLSLLT